MRKLYVNHPRGIRIAGIGWRAYGDFFADLPEEMHNELAARDDFSKTAPKVDDLIPEPEVFEDEEDA